MTKIDAKTRTRIRSALRKISRWTEAIKNTRKKAWKRRGVYECEECGKEVKKVEIDHLIPVGPTPGSRLAPEGYTWDEFIGRLFCGEENLRALCKECHSPKTKKDKEGYKTGTRRQASGRKQKAKSKSKKAPKRATTRKRTPRKS